MNREPKSPCHADPEYWFTDGARGTEARQQQQNAARICKTQCAMRLACLELALRAEAGQPTAGRHGVYGGFTPSERADMDPTVVKPKRPAKQPAQALAA